MLKYILLFLISINLYSQNININNYKEKIIEVDEQIHFLDSIITSNSNKNILFKANYEIGMLYYKKKSDFLLSKKHLLVANIIALELNEENKIYDSYLKLGFCYKRFHIKDSALYYYNKSLALANNNNNLNLVSRSYSNIARLYTTEKDFKNAIKYYSSSIVAGKLAKRNLSTTYNNLGNVYLLVNNDSAITYYKKSIHSAIKLKNKHKELMAYLNLGNAYLNDSTQIKKGYKYLIKGKIIAERTDEIRMLCYIHFYLGQYFEKTKNFKKSLDNYNKALSSKMLLKDLELKIEILNQMAKFYEKFNNFKKANSFQKKHHHLKDSIYTLEKNKAFNDIQTKYEVEKKDNKINVLTKEKQLEQSRKNAIIIGATSILAVLLLLTYFLRNKIKTQKVVQAKEHELFTQELKIKKALSHIEGQESEQHRLAKELHDGLGGQLAGIKSLIQTINTSNLYEKTNMVDKHLANSIKNLRNISHDLSANFLKNKDFNLLIQQLVQQTFVNKSIQTEISIFPQEKINALPEQYKLNIYRILQESFQNILKHANASSVSISLSLDKEINLLVEDNGIGFNTSNKSNGIGLQNITDRLQSLNGKIQMDSKLTKGTTLNINIPYK